MSRLDTIMRDNDLVVSILSEYINHHPRFIDAAMVDDLARECHVSNHEAFCTLLSAACGLDTVDNPTHRALERQYFIPSLRKLDPAIYVNDAYAKTVKFPSITHGKWELCQHSYAPYEPFVRTHPVVTRELCEIPQLGYFDVEFPFPAILENGIEWMTITPNEVETMREPIAKCRGRVLTLGLGLGYFAFHASEKDEVERVVVVERSRDVIEIFKTYLLPQLPHGDKIEIVEADAFEYMQKEMPRGKFDYVFADLWHDASDGLEMYRKLKKYEILAPSTEFDYWIEPSLLSLLRHIIYRRITDEKEPLNLGGLPPETVLTDDFLRKLQ
jgi:SAM-dependent methyltransferase